MSEKPGLVAAGNTLIPAYLALRQKGYRVYRGRSEEAEWWHAETDAHHFVAEDPLQLLGLVALYETRGDVWPADDAEIDDFLAEYGDA